MNSEITVHPKLQHYGLTTASLDAMIDWYRKAGVWARALHERAFAGEFAPAKPSDPRTLL